MFASKEDAMQRHLERQARGRQQRRWKDEHLAVDVCDPLSFDPLSAYRRIAGQMLADFHVSGVDEDLEVLKAGWANHFKRPGHRPFEESILAVEGERAKQRLKGLERLRQLAGSDGRNSLPSLVGSRSDAWADWESRWSQEFRRLEERERLERDAKAAEMRAAQEARAAEAAEAARWARQKREKKAKSNCGAVEKSARPVPTRFGSFGDFSQAWKDFEARLAKMKSVRLQDIPWPDGLPSVSGITSSDSPSDAKKKLRTALLRWHPDKWGTILDHVAESDKVDVIARVKLVTQRILDEKKRQDAK